ncbi:MAG: tetratricopeptide repeat protein, partial [Bacteroidales bacterium]|nr:tetratricopeptide repeat protein [Bacteroidales bacterium]
MKNLFLIVIFILFSVQLFAQKERKFIRKGNEYFNSAYSDSTKKDTADFSKAEVSYRKAIEKKPESFDAAFNLGDALYKQKKFKEASNQFQTLASNQKDKQKLAQTYHNLGNSLLQSNKLEESIEAYKNSLRSNPEDMATKYNLAFAQDKLKKQKQQQKNQKQNKQNKDQKDNKDKKNKDKKNQDKNKQDKQQ